MGKKEERSGHILIDQQAQTGGRSSSAADQNYLFTEENTFLYSVPNGTVFYIRF
jgi:hypothetical protein